MRSTCLTATGHALTHAPQEVQDQSSSSVTEVIGSAPTPFSFSRRLSFLTRTLGESCLPAAVAGHADSHAPISTHELYDSFSKPSNSESRLAPIFISEASTFPSITSVNLKGSRIAESGRSKLCRRFTDG